MTVMQTQEIRDWPGRTLYGRDNVKIGKISDIYLDQQSGRPEWMAVHTGLFGLNVSFVPLADARSRGEDVIVPFGKETVKAAPNAEEDGFLSPEEEDRLFRHYGLDPGMEQTGMDQTQYAGPPPARSDRKADTRSADNAMTRSEEELRVTKGTQERGRARLHKWVETEHVSTTVPVSHEEVRVEREPITQANIDQALSGPEISAGDHEVILHEERVVAAKEAVPVERVRLVTETVTENQEVTADVRKERIDMEGIPAKPNRRG